MIRARECIALERHHILYLLSGNEMIPSPRQYSDYWIV